MKLIFRTFLVLFVFSSFTVSNALADKICVKKNAKIVNGKVSLKKAIFFSTDCGTSNVVLDTNSLAVQGTPGVKGDKGEKGDTGLTGPSGVLNYEVLNNTFTNVGVNSLTQTTQTLSCPLGKVVLGGSCFFSGGEAPFFTYIGTKIVSGSPDQWQCVIRNPSGSNRFIDITMSATCATPS